MTEVRKAKIRTRVLQCPTYNSFLSIIVIVTAAPLNRVTQLFVLERGHVKHGEVKGVAARAETKQKRVCYRQV